MFGLGRLARRAGAGVAGAFAAGASPGRRGGPCAGAASAARGRPRPWPGGGGASAGRTRRRASRGRSSSRPARRGQVDVARREQPRSGTYGPTGGCRAWPRVAAEPRPGAGAAAASARCRPGLGLEPDDDLGPSRRGWPARRSMNPGSPVRVIRLRGLPVGAELVLHDELVLPDRPGARPACRAPGGSRAARARGRRWWPWSFPWPSSKIVASIVRIVVTDWIFPLFGPSCDEVELLDPELRGRVAAEVGLVGVLGGELLVDQLVAPRLGALRTDWSQTAWPVASARRRVRPAERAPASAGSAWRRRPSASRSRRGRSAADGSGASPRSRPAGRGAAGFRPGTG